MYVSKRLTFLQCQKLLFDAAHESIVHIELYILPLVLLSHGNGGTSWLQFVHHQSAKAIVLHTESGLDDAADVALPEMKETIRNFSKNYLNPKLTASR